MNLLDLIFPPICLHCSRGGGWLCERCEGDLLPCHPLKRSSIRCYPGLNPILSAYVYQAPLESAIKSVKYHFTSAAIPLFAKLIDRELGKTVAHWKLDALVPIPLHRKKHAWRGFNQSELLCKELGKIWKLPVLPVLERRTFREAQAGSTKRERQKLVHDFALITGIDENLRLALVDDVVTTGGTLSACARELEKRNPSFMGAITLAAA